MNLMTSVGTEPNKSNSGSRLRPQAAASPNTSLLPPRTTNSKINKGHHSVPVVGGSKTQKLHRQTDTPSVSGIGGGKGNGQVVEDGKSYTEFTDTSIL